MTEIPGVGAVQNWVQLVEVSGPLVSSRWTYVFAADGQVLTSDSTLRFREREEVEADLVARGFVGRGSRGPGSIWAGSLCSSRDVPPALRRSRRSTPGK